jgi:hypothetical protein
MLAVPVISIDRKLRQVRDQSRQFGCARRLSRTAQIQPGVFFTFEAPLLRIIAKSTKSAKCGPSSAIFGVTRRPRSSCHG